MSIEQFRYKFLAATVVYRVLSCIFCFAMMCRWPVICNSNQAIILLIRSSVVANELALFGKRETFFDEHLVKAEMMISMKVTCQESCRKNLSTSIAPR